MRSPVCNFNEETTVLAHLRLIGISAMSKKAPDILGAHCCSACHAWVDTHHDPQTKLWFAEGVFRTINLLVREGMIKWSEVKRRGAKSGESQ